MKKSKSNDKTDLPLSPKEQLQLVTEEGVLLAYGKASFEAGRALQAIRDSRLYREFGSFDSYCRAKWGCSRCQADRLAAAWRIAELLAPIGVKVAVPSQVRSLIGLTVEQVQVAGRKALELAGTGALTAEHFRSAAIEIKPVVATRSASRSRSQALKAVSREGLKFIQLAEQAAEAGDASNLRKALEDLKALLLNPASVAAGDAQSQATLASVPITTSDSPAPASDANPSAKLAAGPDSAEDARVKAASNPVASGGHAPVPPANDEEESDEDEPTYECPECNARFADEDTAVTIYECDECGTKFTGEESANGSNQCPECNKFRSTFTELGCPECKEAELQEIER